MKKHVLVIVIAALFTGTLSFGQMKFQVGVKGGVNFATLDNEINYDNRTGYHAGGFMAFKFAKLAIQPEVVLSNQGAIDNADINSLETEFNYINVPIILKSYLVGGLNIQLGPQFGFLTSARREFVEGVKSDIKSQLNDSDISLAMGIGIDLPAGFTIDARYNYGLTEINNEQALSSTKNQVFQVSVSYRLIEFGK